MLKLWMRVFGQGAAWAFLLVTGFFACQYAVNSRHPSGVAKRVIHVFYEAQVDEIESPHAAQETLSAWKYNWQRAGWHPRILTTFDAQHSSLFDDMVEALSHLPAKHGSAKESSCYLRYVAMVAVGGGWLSDSDTVPTHLFPGRDLPNNGTFTVHQYDFAALISGTRSEFERVSKHMIEKLRARRLMVHRLGICQDKLVLRDMIAKKQVLSSESVFPADHWSDVTSCANMTDPDKLAVQFSQAAVEGLGYYVDARGVLMNRSMDRWRACNNKTRILA